MQGKFFSDNLENIENNQIYYQTLKKDIQPTLKMLLNSFLCFHKGTALEQKFGMLNRKNPLNIN